MKHKYKISVIVAVYNAAPTLEKCIDSILNQTFNDFELLLINDGSSDGSKDICDNYAKKDARIRVFHRKNAGISATREFGINKAQGEYSIHVDSDDWIEKEMLYSLYSKAISSIADIVICDFFIDTNEKSDYIKQKPTSLDSIQIIKDILKGKIMGSVWNKLVKQKLYNKFNIHFPTGINFCEDVYVIISLLKNTERIEYIPKPYYHYEMNPKSLSHNPTKETFNQRVEFIESLHKLLGPLYDLEIAQNLVYIRKDAYFSRLFTASELRKLLPYHRSAIFKSPFHIRKKMLLFFASYGLTILAKLLEKKKDKHN